MVDVVLREGEENRLHTKLMTLLIPLSRSGVKDIPTDKLAELLGDLGFSVSVNSLVDHLQLNKPKFIDNVTTGTITFSTPSDAPETIKDVGAEKSRNASRKALQNIKDRAKERRALAKDAL